MQKLILFLAAGLLFIACKKNHGAAQETVSSVIGKWNINTVTVIPFDSAGSAINNGTVYTEPSYYYFQFNSNNTWTENLSVDPSSGIEESGSYTLHGDSSFTLINSNALTKSVECAIDTLTNIRFIFTYRHSTFYNGITPGYLKYIFDLKK